MGSSPAGVIQVEAPCRIVFETDDALSGQVNAATIRQAGGGRPPVNREEANPATGPVSVVGAMPGDALRVRIRRIKIAGEGFHTVSRNRFPDTLDGDLVWFRKLEKGKIPLPGGLAARPAPMIGVIGVAPKGDPVFTQNPGDHGGNMDCSLVRSGSVVYLPVFVPGGLLAIGDVHGTMGDGEVIGNGFEIAAEVEVELSVERSLGISRPVVETRTTWATLASDESLEGAAWKATEDMVTFMVKRTDFTAKEAFLLMGARGNVRVAQIVNPLKTAWFEMAKDYLPRAVST